MCLVSKSRSQRQWTTQLFQHWPIIESQSKLDHNIASLSSFLLDTLYRTIDSRNKQDKYDQNELHWFHTNRSTSNYKKESPRCRLRIQDDLLVAYAVVPRAEHVIGELIQASRLQPWVQLLDDISLPTLPQPVLWHGMFHLVKLQASIKSQYNWNKLEEHEKCRIHENNQRYENKRQSHEIRMLPIFAIQIRRGSISVKSVVEKILL